MLPIRQAPVIAFYLYEPTVFTEYLTDISGRLKKRGLVSVLSAAIYERAPLGMCQVLTPLDRPKGQ